MGVGATRDARALLEWSGSKVSIAHGVVDLEGIDRIVLSEVLRGEANIDGAKGSKGLDTGNGTPEERGLASLCSALLGRRLRKRKHRGRKGGIASKKAHWRAQQLTAEMRTYASADAGASLACFVQLVRRVGGVSQLVKRCPGTAPKTIRRSWR